MQKWLKNSELPTMKQPTSLLDDRYYDNLSGQQAYKCFACRVKKCNCYTLKGEKRAFKRAMIALMTKIAEHVVKSSQ